MANKEKQFAELAGLLARHQYARALPLAERAARQNPRDGNLVALYLVTLVNTGSGAEALNLYHERKERAEPTWPLHQAIALARCDQGLTALALASFRAFQKEMPEDPQVGIEIARLEPQCARRAELRGVEFEQLLVEEEARELLLAGRYVDAVAAGAAWLERFPRSGPLRAGLAAAHYQLGQLSEGLALCQTDETCPSLIFRQLCLLMARGQGRSARQAGRPLLDYRSRTEDELCDQLMGLTLLDQNRAVLKVAKNSDCALNHKGHLCVASACFALGRYDEAEKHLRLGEPFLESGEREFVQDTLAQRDPDLGWLRAFVILELMPREAMDQARSWIGQSPHGIASPGTLREMRKWLERLPMMKKLAPYLWLYADLPQKMLGYLILTACPDDRNLVRRARRFIRSQSPLRQGRQQVLKILGLMGRVRSGAYVFNLGGRRRIVVVHAVKWQPGWTPDCAGKALDMLRQVGPLMAQKRYAEAENMILRALEHAPDSTDLLYQQAIIFRRQGREDECKKRIDRCLELKPEHIGARLTRAGWLARQNRLEEARNLWRQVAKIKTMWIGYMGDFYLAKLEILQKLSPDRARAWLADWRAEQPGHPYQEQFA